MTGGINPFEAYGAERRDKRGPPVNGGPQGGLWQHEV
jgi:hypothetical protein